MNIKYYANKETVSVNAVNIDNIKKISIDCTDDNENIIGNLYLDDIRIELFKIEVLNKYFNKIVSSEKHILEMFNSNVIRKYAKEEYRDIIYKEGFDKFKTYVTSNNITVNLLLDEFKIIGVRGCIQILEEKIIINNSESLNYLIEFLMISLYLRTIKSRTS